jgi:hypothetical protein
MLPRGSSLPWAWPWLGPVGQRERRAGGHLPGHQPPGRGTGHPRQPLKGRLRIQPLSAHQHPLGLLDQSAVLQRGLQLVGQATLDLGGHRRREQAGHQPGIGLGGGDLAVVPIPGIAAVDVQVPIGLPSSSTGTLNAAAIPSPASTRASTPHCGSWRMSRTVAGARWLKAAMHGPWARRSWPSSTSYGPTRPGSDYLSP